MCENPQTVVGFSDGIIGFLYNALLVIAGLLVYYRAKERIDKYAGMFITILGFVQMSIYILKGLGY